MKTNHILKMLLLIVIMGTFSVNAQNVYRVRSDGSFGATSSEPNFTPEGIHVSHNGDAYTWGLALDGADMNPFGLTPTNIAFPATASNQFGYVVAKIGTNGNYHFARSFGFISGNSSFFSHVKINDIATDHQGNFYILGSFNTNCTPSLDLLGGMVNPGVTTSESYFTFVAKYNSNGSYLWHNLVAEGANSYGHHIDVSINGDVVISGRHVGDVDMDPGGGTFTLAGDGLFLSRYDSNGNYLTSGSIQPVGSGNSWASDNTQDLSAEVKFTGTGNIAICFNAQGTYNFDITGGTNNLTSNTSVRDAFLSVYNANTLSLQWAKRVAREQAANPTQNDFIRDIEVDQNGDIYITGESDKTIYFDDAETVSLPFSYTSRFIYLAKYNQTTGNVVWAKNAVNPNGNSSSAWLPNIGIDHCGSISLTGRMHGTCNFDPNGSYNISGTSGGQDAVMSFYSAADGSLQNAGTHQRFGTEQGIGLDANPNGQVSMVGFGYSSVGNNMNVDAGLPGPNSYIAPDNNGYIVNYRPNAHSLNFDGINDHLNMGNHAQHDLDTALTLECWFKTSSTANQTIIWNRSNGGTEGYGIKLIGGNQLTAYIGTATVTNTVSVQGTWNHVAVTWDKSENGGEVLVYLNGALLPNTAFEPASLTAYTGNAFIGSAVPAASDTWHGNLDELRIWNSALCPSKIVDRMNCEIQSAQAGLVSSYSMNYGINFESPGLFNAKDVISNLNASFVSFDGISSAGPTSNWALESALSKNQTCSPNAGISLVLTGNGAAITNGATTSSVSNGTDLAGVGLGLSQNATFVLSNTSTNFPLNISSVTSSNPNFTISTNPSGTIATGSSSNLVLTFAPTALGPDTTIITINSDDCDNPAYTFIVTGIGSGPASALNFDGINDHISLSNNVAYNLTDALTFEAWFKTSSIGNQTLLWNSGTFGSSQGYGFILTGNGTTMNATIGGVNVANTVNVLGSWNHVAVTWDRTQDGGAIKMYINGILQPVTANLTTPIPVYSGTKFIGLYPHGSTIPWRGDMDEVRIWNRALCQGEIQHHMNCEIPTTESGLISNFHFNQGNDASNNTGVNIATDAASGHIAILNNFALTGSSSNWTSPGGVISGTNCVPFVAPEISITGNGIEITTGTTTTSSSNNTDMGTVYIGTTGTASFVVNNPPSGSELIISSVSSSNPNFSVTTDPTGTISGGTTGGLVISYSPTVAGTETTTITINNSDCDEPIYTFNISASANFAPGAALHFDGVNDRIDLGNISESSSAMSFETWFKPTSTANNVLMWNSGTFGSNQGFGIILTGGGTTMNATFGGVNCANTVSVLNTWNHLAVTWDRFEDGGAIKMYLNGVLLPNTANLTSNIPNYSGSAFIGMYPFGSSVPFAGEMDETRLWNQALCQGEIEHHMNCEIPTTATGLVANYHYNQGVAGQDNSGVTVLNDATGSINGTLQNFSLNGTASNWITPGAITSGTACAPYIAPEIVVSGNSVEIASGSTSGSTTNDTDFGPVCLGNMTAKTFTISNSIAGSNLSIGTITSSNTNFAITSTPANAISGIGSTTFTITYTANASGTETSMISISNNDCDENPYTFVVTATEGSNTGTDVITACDSYTWINGTTYTASNNTATHTLTNAAGCDSVVTLNLTINYSNTGTDVITACDSYTWIDGATYTASNNTATHTLTNAAGCDSVVTLNLTINNSNTGMDVITACDSYTWIDGATYTASNNTATHTLTNAAGCDSVVTLNLTINYSNTGTDVITACDSYTWINGTTYTASNNTATHTLTNTAGCDSVVTLNLTINNSNTGMDVITACDSYTWIDGATYTASNNTATHTLTNAAGCDSVVTLNLTINYSNTGMDVITACDSYTWIDGTTYTASNNTATHTLTNAAGCDSVVTLNLTINNSNTGMDVITSCDSYTWIDGTTYTASNNTATHTLTNAAGCDSVVTLNLTINNSNTGTDVITACDSYTWIDGTTYTASNNTATHTLTNAAGCDSVVTLNLTINNSNTGTDVITACDSYTWIDGTTYTASNNTATHTLTNAAGCDSVVTLNLTINMVDASLTTSGITMTANATGTYQWIDCSDNSPIPGATNQTYEATVNGSYAVIVDNGNCSDTSDCVSITTVGIHENGLNAGISIFPNPSTNGVVSISSQVEIETIEIFDAFGRKVLSIINDISSQIDVSNLAKGSYLIKFTYGSSAEIIRFTKAQ